MANESRDPQDQANFGRLEGELKGLRADFRAMGETQQEQAVANDRRAREQQRREQQRAARERQSIPRRGVPAEEVPPAELERGTRAENERTRATERRASAEKSQGQILRERIRLERELRRQASLPVPTSRYAGPLTPGQAIGGLGSRIGLQAGAEQLAAQSRVQAAQAERLIENARAIDRAGTRANYFANPRRAQLALPAAGGTGGPPFVPPTAVGGTAPGDEPRKRGAMAEALNRERAAATSAAGAEDTLNRAFRSQVASVGLANDAYRRHGALTTEFISAAARGQVTFRELEYQVGATIGKFAGWTAAAASVYGVLAAVTALGSGAIQSENGVQRLQRVVTQGFDADKLRQGFRDLQGQFNLPTDQVVDAVYGSAKIFNNQSDALEAAKASLFAVKVGELDAATATRYLTSIVAGFQLTAQDLPQVFDAINQAQNRFGGNTGQVVAGVAKAAGAFRLAGGSYKELIALIQTGTRLTGASGENVGTAISRSASRVLTKQGQDALKQVGLTPGQPYIQLLAQAMKESQGASPERVNELARALVPQGGQFARIYAPLLQNRQLYNQILSELQSDRTRGSSQRELHRALQEPSEQVKQLYSNMQRLGGALAQTGALTPFAGLLKGLNLSINGMVKLVELFDQLTFGAGKVLVPLAEVAGLIALMRRFDLGGRLPVGTGAYESFRGGLRRNPQALLDADIRRGQDEAKKYVDDQHRITRQQSAGAAFTASRERSRFSDAERDFGAGRIGEDEYKRAATRYESRLQRAADLASDAEALEAQAVAIREETLAYDRARRSGLASEAAAAQAGIYYRPGTLERPSPGVGPVPIQSGTGRPRDVLRYIDDMEAATANMSRGERAMLRGNQAFDRLGQSQSRVARMTAGGARTLQTVAAGAAGTAQAIGRMGQMEIGALDGILLIGFAALEAYNIGRDKVEQTRRQIESLSRQPGGDPKLSIDRARAELANKGSLLDRAQDLFARGYRTSDIGQIFGGDPRGANEQRDAAARNLLGESRALARAQRRGGLLPLGQIQTRARTRIAAARTASERLAALEDELTAIDHGYAIAKGGPEAIAAARRMQGRVRAQIAAIKAGSGSIEAALANIRDLDSLGAYVQQLQVDVQRSPRITRPLVRRSQVGAIAGARLLAAAATPEDELKALQQIKAAQDAVLEAEATQLQRLVEFARNPAESGRARQQYLGVVRQTLIGQRPATIERLRSAEQLRNDAIERAQRQVQGIDYSQRVNPIGGTPDDSLLARLSQGGARLQQRRALQARIRRLRAANTTDEKTVKALEDQLKINRQELKYIEQQQQRAQYEFQIQVYDARTSRLQSETADPLQQARILADRMVSRVARAREAYRKGIINIGDLEQTLAQQNQALQQVAQAEVSRFQAQQGVASSRYALSVGGDQGATLRYAIGQSQRFLSFVQSKGDKLDPETLLRAQAAVYDAQLAYQQYVKQQAAALEQARLNLSLSRTEDPVKQATIRLRGAQQAFKRAETPAERVQAQADINNARREARQAAQSDKFEDLQFRYDMGKITKEAYITALEQLLGTIKGNKDLRRQIRRQIQSLRKEIDSEADLQNLQVGDIRLPTVYEIRRAVQSSGRGASGQGSVTIYNNPDVRVEVNDPHQVGRVASAIDQTLGTSTSSSLRAAGLL